MNVITDDAVEMLKELRELCEDLNANIPAPARPYVEKMVDLELAIDRINIVLSGEPLPPLNS